MLTYGYILQCARCKWYHSYKPSKKIAIRGYLRIDTICGVCGSRLRHTHRPQGWAWELKTVPPAYAKGSGRHNESVSVLWCLRVARSKADRETSDLNKKRQKWLAKNSKSSGYFE